MKESDRYLKIVEWSEEDGCYVGTCLGLMSGGVHGDNEADVYKELCEVVEEWIEIYREDGEDLPETTSDKDYSGKLVLRVGKKRYTRKENKAIQFKNERLPSNPGSQTSIG